MPTFKIYNRLPLINCDKLVLLHGQLHDSYNSQNLFKQVTKLLGENIAAPTIKADPTQINPPKARSKSSKRARIRSGTFIPKEESQTGSHTAKIYNRLPKGNLDSSKISK